MAWSVREKMSWEQEISLVDIFYLSTLMDTLAVWYGVQYCTNGIFMSSSKSLIGWPAQPAAPLRLSCTLSLCLMVQYFFFIKHLVVLKESFTLICITYTWFCVCSLLWIFVQVLITPDTAPDIRSNRSDPHKALVPRGTLGYYCFAHG